MSVSIQVIQQSLLRYRGSISETAHDLGLPVHYVKQLIKQSAALQAVMETVDIEIADQSRRVIHSHLHDPNVSNAKKLGTARWALEHLASDVYRKAHNVDVTDKSKAYSDLTLEDLNKRIEELKNGLDTDKIVDVPFEQIDLYNERPRDEPEEPDNILYLTEQLMEASKEKEQEDDE